MSLKTIFGLQLNRGAFLSLPACTHSPVIALTATAATFVAHKRPLTWYYVTGTGYVAVISIVLTQTAGFCLIQPPVEQWLKLAHVLEAELQSFKATNGGL